MLEVLLESRQIRPPRPLAATALSAATHAGLAFALLGGARAVRSYADVPDVWEQLARRFLAPPQALPSVAGERISFVAMSAQGGPTGLNVPEAVPVKVTKHTLGDAVIPQKVSIAVDLDPAMLLARAAKSLGAFTIVEVDSVAERDPRSAAPSYPPNLLAKNIEGFATFRFVIDSTGVVDLSTVKVVDASNAEFVQAVRDAMPRMRFRPAMRASQYVRQLVEQPFRFRIQPSTVPAGYLGESKPDHAA